MAEASKQSMSVDERDIAMSALHDIMEMEWGDRKETPFQFEQRIHKVAHDAWAELRRTSNQDSESA